MMSWKPSKKTAAEKCEEFAKRLLDEAEIANEETKQKDRELATLKKKMMRVCYKLRQEKQTKATTKTKKKK